MIDPSVKPGSRSINTSKVTTIEQGRIRTTVVYHRMRLKGDLRSTTKLWPKKLDHYNSYLGEYPGFSTSDSYLLVHRKLEARLGFPAPSYRGQDGYSQSGR